MIDTHCHLDADEFAADLDMVLGEALRRGVTSVVIPAVDPSNWEAVRAITTKSDPALPERRYALGMHPVYIDRCDDAAINALRAAATAARADPLFVGIGEIGLDHFVAGLDLDRQLAFFVAQLRIARDLDLPVILHVRRAIDPVSRELRRLGPFSGIAHAFNGSAPQAATDDRTGSRAGLRRSGDVQPRPQHPAIGGQRSARSSRARDRFTGHRTRLACPGQEHPG